MIGLMRKTTIPVESLEAKLAVALVAFEPVLTQALKELRFEQSLSADALAAAYVKVASAADKVVTAHPEAVVAWTEVTE